MQVYSASVCWLGVSHSAQFTLCGGWEDKKEVITATVMRQAPKYSVGLFLTPVLQHEAACLENTEGQTPSWPWRKPEEGWGRSERRLEQER